MTNVQLIAWANGPVTRAQLQAACAGHGLATNGTIADLRTRLQAHLAALPPGDLAAWNPPAPAPAPAAVVPPAAAAPAPAPAVAPAPVPVVHHYPWVPIGGTLVGAAALIMAFAFGIWLLRQPSPTTVTARNDTITIKTEPIKVEPIGFTNPGGQTGGGSQDTGKGGNQTASAPPQQASGSVSTDASGQIVIDTLALNDGRSYEARTTMAQPDLGYAPYEDTGIGKHKIWDIKVPEGYTAIAVGVKVNSSNLGNINAYKGPIENLHLDIVDGARDVVPNDQALGNYCTRWKQHVDNGWLSRNLRPLSEWGNKPCSAA